MKNKLASEPPDDRLTLAAILLSGAALFCLLAVLAVTGLRLWRPDAAAEAVCRQFVRRYGAHTIALMPVGQNLRHSDGRRPFVDLRYDPRLPLENPDDGLVFPPQPARYVFSAPAPQDRRTGMSETE
jgi:hypothetical protein